jgi:hypothetical protein
MAGKDPKAEIRKKVAAQFADDGVTADEVVLKDNGDVVIDRRAKSSWAKPVKVGEWR